MKKTTAVTIGGREIIFETGKLAPQADAAVLVRAGDTVVLAAVTASKQESKLDYFPLTVEYAEKLYAGGRIKGSRWVKREGRPTDDAILNARLIDRSIRPLFPKSYHHDVQVIVTILSVDLENDPDLLGLLGVSAALSLSPVPWNGPIAAVRVGKVENNLIINPSQEQMEESLLDLVVSGSHKKILMIEAGAQEIVENEMFSAIKNAHEEIKKANTAIAAFAKEHGTAKHNVPEKKVSTLVATLEKKYGKKLIELLTAKVNKKAGAAETYNELVGTIVEEYGEKHDGKEIVAIIDEMFEVYVRELALKKGKRIDGRSLTDIRPLSTEVGVLPRTHGSALFQRGNTQALTITTLGAPSMEQWLESAEGEEKKRYMHHYNMPPYSVGETGRFGYPSRREIGHGALAERALIPVIPSEDEFPYTIHVVSEILSSNGSTSMASTCGSTLSLMDAGVPIKEPVAGISIGLVSEGERFVLLTDIMGVEDFTGDMDFKVAGTKNGITAIQLDVKIAGIQYDVIEQTFVRAKEVRMKILEVMQKTIPQPRTTVSQFAPKIETVQIPTEKIGEVIGPGGKMIRSIIAATECDIDVEDDGTVTVASQDSDKVKHAVEWIKNMVREVEPGETFNGVVKRILPFGAFVEILPGKEGLVHLSQMSTEYVNKPEDIVSMGQKVQVQVVEIDEQGRLNLSMLSKEERENKKTARSSNGRPQFDRGGEREGGRGRGDYRGGREHDYRRRPREPYQHPHLKENR